MLLIFTVDSYALISLTSRVSPSVQSIDLRNEQVLNKVLDSEFEKDSSISVHSLNQKILIVGEVANSSLKKKVDILIQQQPIGNRKIFNQLNIDNNFTKADAEIDKKIKDDIIKELVSSFPYSSTKIIVFKRNVYLMGIITKSESNYLSRISSTTSGVKQVFLFFDIITDFDVANLDQKIPGSNTLQKEQNNLTNIPSVSSNQIPIQNLPTPPTPDIGLVGKRLALIIGNASYNTISPLENPINDVRLMSNALKSSGFDVIKYENLDLRQMQNAVRDFGSKLGKNDVGLFYFAGHGVQVKGKNYLIPVRENIKKSFEVPSSALDADLVLATMENAKNNLNIMILDACRSPFPGEARSLNRGLATLDAAKGTLIAYATAPGKEALDGQGNNSPYTKHLVRALGQRGLSIEQVFKQVRIAVVEETKGNQVPWENSSIMGDFYFRK